MKDCGFEAPTRKTICRWLPCGTATTATSLEKKTGSTQKKPRKLSPRVKKKLKAKLELLGTVKKAANCTIRDEQGKRIRLSRASAAKVRDEFFKVKEPTNNKIVLTAHHRKMRKEFAQRELAKWKQRKVFFSLAVQNLTSSTLKMN